MTMLCNYLVSMWCHQNNNLIIKKNVLKNLSIDYTSRLTTLKLGFISFRNIQQYIMNRMQTNTIEFDITIYGAYNRQMSFSCFLLNQYNIDRNNRHDFVFSRIIGGFAELPKLSKSNWSIEGF